MKSQLPKFPLNHASVSNFLQLQRTEPPPSFMDMMLPGLRRLHSQDAIRVPKNDVQTKLKLMQSENEKMLLEK